MLHRRRPAHIFTPVLLLALSVIVALPVTIGAPPAGAHEGGGEEEALRMTLVQGAPDLVVDVRIGERRSYREISAGVVLYLGSDAGTTVPLTFIASGSTEVLLETDVALPADSPFTVLFHLRADGSPTVTTFDNTAEPVATGAGRLTVRHQGHGSAVDLVLTPDRQVVFGDVAPGEQRSIVLPVGELEVEAVPAGSDAGPLPGLAVSVTEGDATVVYVVGLLGSGSGAGNGNGDGADDPPNRRFAILADTVHGLEIDPDAIAPVDVNAALDGGRSIPMWIHFTAAGVTAALLAAAAARFGRRRARAPVEG